MLFSTLIKQRQTALASALDDSRFLFIVLAYYFIVLASHNSTNIGRKQ